MPWNTRTIQPTAERAVLALLALAACGGGSAPPQVMPTAMPQVTTTMEALEADSVANTFISRLIQSENDLVEPDSLFASDALVIADGEPRGSVPRLAGVGLGGTLQLVTTRVASRGAFVWGVMEYRWLPSFESDVLRVGVATLIIAKLPDGSWRIVHLHSSSPRPASPAAEPSDTTGDPGGPPGITGPGGP
jgi:hypothetical protein